MMKVIIVGGGMTGVSLALAISVLSQRKIQVALVEANLPNKSHLGFNLKTIALAYETCCQFEKIGVWDGLKKYVTPITHIHISEYGHAAAVNIYAKDYSLSAFGYVVKLHDAENYLFEQLEKESNIELYCPDKVISIERTIEQVLVKLKIGKILIGQLLVAADGGDSMIGKASKIEWKQDSYQQCAIIANVLTSEMPDGRAFERFTKYGPLAMLPITQGRSSLVWCHPLKNQQDIMQWSNKQFIAELQKWFGWQLGKIKAVSKRHCFPLVLSQAKKVVSHRLVLVGNAAQTLHPIAAQGFNLAMRDVMVLASLLSKLGNCCGDVGAYSILSQYQIHRYNDRRCTIKLTDNLVHLFSNNHLIFIIGRKIGLMIMETLPFMRDILVHQVMGRSFYLQRF